MRRHYTGAMGDPLLYHHWERAPDAAPLAGVHPVLAGSFHRRGIADDRALTAFLQPGSSTWLDPMALSGMDRAVTLVREVMDRQGKICVYGDYDVDGLTGSAALWRLLKPLYDHLGVYIPQRSEGYGLSREGLERLATEYGVDLVITVDNGTTAFEQVAHGKSLGLNIIVTDHHQPQAELPGADVVLNPHLPGNPGGYGHLSGCGVAFKLGAAVAGSLGVPWEDLVASEIDLLGLSTLSDRMPLLGENRFFSREGLLSIQRGSRVGLRILKERVGLNHGRVLTGEDMDFQLIPRLNAAGRMGSPMTTFQLLVEEDKRKAAKLAAALEAANTERRRVQDDVYREAVRGLNPEDPPWAVVNAGEWHFGVLGVVAGRLAETMARPTVLLCPDEGRRHGSDRILKGSCRNPTHADLLGVLHEAVAEGLALKAGGHAAAQGVEIAEPALPEFSALVQERCRGQLTAEPPTRSLELDGAVTFAQADTPLVAQLEAMEPFGRGNPTPNFLLEGVFLEKAEYRGSYQEHLKLQAVDRQGHRRQLIFFQGGRATRPTVLRDERADLVVTLSRGHYPGDGPVSFKVVDLRLHGDG